MVIIMIVLMIAVGVGGYFLAIRPTLKQMKEQQNVGGVVLDDSNVKTAQDFLPFVTIENNVINLGGFKYRAIVECTSTNYILKTQAEKDIMEASFIKFLNSIGYPISFFIQTKEINYGSIVSGLRKDIDESTEMYPQLKDYAEYYFNEIVNLKNTINNTKQKRKYIIIPYEEAISMNELNAEEKKEYSEKEIENRVIQVIDGLSTIGLKGTMLNTKDLIELMYSMYHRDDDSFIENIGSGEFLTDIVTGEKPITKNDQLKEAIEILQEAENKFKVKILDTDLSIKANDLFNAISEEINKSKRGLITISENGGLKSLKTIDELFENDEDGEVIRYDNNINKNGEIEDEEDNFVTLDINKYKNDNNNGGGI